MGVSQFARGIAESPTMALNERARVLREQGESIVHLGIGEPQNAAPKAAVDAAAAKLAGGKIKYTPTTGVPSFKKAIIRYTETNYGRTVGPKNVIVCSGAKQAIFNALWTILDPGDEVILLAPYWVSYPEMVKMCRAVPVVVTPRAGSLTPAVDDIVRAVTPRTRAIIVNSPNNPSGMVFSREMIGALVQFCEDRGIHAIMDDIYHKLVFDGVAAPSCYEFTTRETERQQPDRRQRHREDVRDDRVPDRLGGRERGDRHGDGARSSRRRPRARRASARPAPKGRCSARRTRWNRCASAWSATAT